MVRRDLLRSWTEVFREHRGKILGSLAGLVFGLMVLMVGLLWTLFIGLCVFVGYLVGRRVDEGKEDLLDMLDRLLPPGQP
ncbi:MAG: DUF2273 domain-containing protein [bacterium]|nr:DUF2273 domain-containing protein [bacterium]